VAQPYIGEIRIFAGNFAPAGWSMCEGQLIAISENETLFQLIGTTYGGDGESTFGLPDLRGRIPVHQGSGFSIGELAGTETVLLTTNQLPIHTHPFAASSDANSTPNAAGNTIGTPLTATPFYAAPPTVGLSPQSVTPQGDSQPHTNFAPYLCLNFIISMFGIFPSQT
jgi:microcystin-dependent protein